MPTTTDVYSSPGSYTWTVPDGVYEVYAELWGGAGGDDPGGVGANGGTATGTIPVSPGDTLNIYVGGRGQDASNGNAGGFNGGGNGGSTSSTNGAGGGGGSDIRLNGDTLNDRVIVAGGGGAAGYDTDHDGGRGGGTQGEDGSSPSSTEAGQGGTQTSGGSSPDPYSGGPGEDGSFGQGGAGNSYGACGGGGGGGWYGGGGGPSSSDVGYAGGGGSGYYDGNLISDGTTSVGGSSGDGEVQISYTEPLDPQIDAVTADQIDLSWNNTDSENEWDVLRSTSSGSTESDYNVIASGLTTASYSDTGLTNGRTYHYRIKAYHDDGSTRLSDEEETATTNLPAPTLNSVKSTDVGEVSLEWTKNDNNSDGDWRVRRRRPNVSSFSRLSYIGLSNRSYTDTDSLLDGGEYQYQLVRHTGDEIARTNSSRIVTQLPPVNNLNVDSVSGRSATLSWSDPSNYAFDQRVLLRKSPDPSYTQDNQSFDDDYPKWTVNNGGRATDYVWEGGYSFYSGADGTGMQASRTYFPGGGQPAAFTYYWRETSSSTGGGVRLKNSNGNYEMGIATDNPEWDVDDGNGIDDSLAVHDDQDPYYGAWRRFTIHFDWANATFGLHLEDLSGGHIYSDSGRPLKQGVDIETVELWNYNAGTWGSNNLDMWWDGLYFAGSIPYTTTELLDGQQYDATVETTTQANRVRETPVSDGLVLYLPMEASHVASGTATSVGLHNIDGSVTGGPVATLSPVGYGYDFGGDVFNFGNPEALQITGDLTIAFWIRPDTFDNRETIIDKAYGGEFTVNWEGNGSEPRYVRFYHGNAGGNGQDYHGIETTHSIYSGEWTHVILERDTDAKEKAAWLDGSLDTTETYSPVSVSSTNDVRIGTGYTNDFYGGLADLRIYNRLLTDTEKTALYQMGSQ